MRLRESLARLHQLWQIEPPAPRSRIPLVGPARRLAAAMARWYTQPILEQQRAFNAAATNAIQALADSVEREP